MAGSKKKTEESLHNSSTDEESVIEVNPTKVCFICMERGDPITNKLKVVTAHILSKSVLAINERNKLGIGRKSIDISKINIPQNLQMQYKFHQSCYRELIKISGKKSYSFA